MNTNNKRQVESQRAWLLFVFYVLVATFIGGAFRALLSPAQLRFWIEEQLAHEQPKFNLKFEEVSFSLSEAWSPRFGVEFKGLLIESRDPCVTRSEMNIKDLYVPVSLAHLIAGDFRFNDIQASKIEFIQRPKVCNADTNLEQEESFKAPDPSVDTSDNELQAEASLSDVKSFLQNRLAKEIYNTREWFSTLSIDEIIIYKEAKPEQVLILTDFYFDVFKSEDSLEIDTDIDLNFQDTEYDSEPVHLKLQLSRESINGELTGSFKEGKLLATLLLDMQTGKISTDANLEYMPVNEIVSIWNSFRTSKLNFSPKLMWLNCQLSGSALFDEYKKMSIDFSNCNISGDAGQIIMQELSLQPFAEEQSPIQLKLKKLSLKRILEYFDSGKNLNGVLTHFGQIHGDVSLYSKNNYEFAGDIRDIEILFSSRGKKRIQKIKNMKLEITWKDSRVSGLIDEINLSQGEFAGDVSFNFDHQFDNGTVNIQISKLKLNDQIDHLMVLGKMQPIEIYGKAKLLENKLSMWSGALGTTGIQNDKWAIKNIKIKSDFTDNVLVNQVTIEELSTEQNTIFAKYLYPLLLDFREQQSAIHLQSITGRIDLENKKGQWKNFAASAGPNILLASAGEWNYRGGTRGWVSVDLENLKLLTWEVTGSSKSPEIMPTVKMMKRLAQKDSSLKVPESSQAKVRMDFLRKSLKQDNISNLKKFGKKVVEKAKEILPKIKQEDNSELAP